MLRYLALAGALALGACAAEPTQTIQGRVDRTGFTGTVLGARAIAGDTVVATTPVRADGSFALELPAGTGYRLEVITSGGAQPVVGQTSGVIATFDICDPGEPYDLGDIFQGDAWPGCDPATDENCGDPGGGCTDPSDPNCCANPLPDGTCGDGTDPGCDPSTDPSCCDPNTGENCGGTPGCTDPTDPNCCANPLPDGTCGDGTDPGCDPNTGENCGDPGGGCTNPLPDGTCGDGCIDADGNNVCDCDPNTGENCGDPGCPDADNDGVCDGTDPGGCEYDDPTLCWPPPDGEPCDANGVCDPGDCAVPEEPIPDFGC